MKKIYILEGWKAYEGSNLLGAFETRQLAESAKNLAEKMLSDGIFDNFEISESVLHAEIPAWRKILKDGWTVSKKRIRRLKSRP
jgi:hypothetical protein